ncbi:hypothetical protein CXF95_16530 [Paraglaciecola sp. MB-3u-78]|nr:hypothetical protein CXF95_16530 [Paraglaciecola sp. MB-3u-78]
MPIVAASKPAVERAARSSGIQGADYVYAVWTGATDVPAPGTVILLSLGIAGLFLSRHRKQ